jgi:hypothetical protein
MNLYNVNYYISLKQFKLDVLKATVIMIHAAAKDAWLLWKINECPSHAVFNEHMYSTPCNIGHVLLEDDV